MCLSKILQRRWILLPKLNIVLGNVETLPEMTGKVVGIDYGAYVCLKNGIHMFRAYGDFDSVTDEQFEEIKKNANKVIRLPKEKDETDFEAYLNSISISYYDEVNVYGGLDGRLDHTLINMRIASKYPNVMRLISNKNRVMAFGQGEYEIRKDDYTYIGFFTNDHAVVSVGGVHYGMSHKELTQTDLFTGSNEIYRRICTLKVHSGIVIVIQSND